MPLIKAEQINAYMCKTYDLTYFDCKTALFGDNCRKNEKYVVFVSQQRVQEISEYQADCFDMRLENGKRVLIYLLQLGLDGVVYIQ